MNDPKFLDNTVDIDGLGLNRILAIEVNLKSFGENPSTQQAMTSAWKILQCKHQVSYCGPRQNSKIECFISKISRYHINEPWVSMFLKVAASP